MGAPEHLRWQFEQARARRRVRLWRRLEVAGYLAALFSTGVAVGLLAARAVGA